MAVGCLQRRFLVRSGDARVLGELIDVAVRGAEVDPGVAAVVDPGGQQQVAPFELFFDLVFVFAVMHRWRMTAMTWRLAAAFWASTQLGSNSRLSRILARVISGYGPGP
jgi:hypothetical protein